MFRLSSKPLRIIFYIKQTLMSSKTLVLVAFAVWSFICWRWYVCGIKQQCGPQAAAIAAPVAETPAIEPDTANTSRPAFQPISTPEDKYSTGQQQGATEPISKAEPDISKVYVEELKDHVVIHFPYNSTRKEDNEAINDYLGRLAQQLIAQGGSVTLTGHTDNVGDTKTNELFAMRRAKNIRDILIAKGVNKSQITTKSFGEKKPVATNDNPRGRYKNRRVEIRVK